MGTIEKRGRNSWRVGVQVQTDNGWEWVRRTVSFPPTTTQVQQRAAAEVALAQLALDVEEGRSIPDRATNFRELSALWLSNYVQAECEPPTQKTYNNFLKKRLLPALGDMPLHAITPLLLSTFLANLRKEPKAQQRKPDDQLKRKRTPSDQKKLTAKEAAVLSDTTIRHYYDTLNSILKHGVMWEMMPRNPLDVVPRPKVRKKKIKYLDDEQAVRLLRCLKDEENMSFRSAVLLALTCGLRLGGVGALKLSDVDWQQGTIDIQRARAYTPETGNYDGTPKTEAGERLIALPAAMLTLLDETRKYQEDIALRVGDVWQGDGRIVCAWNGTPLHHDTPSKQWRTFADKTATRASVFMTCATLMPRSYLRIILTLLP
ncbi:MAG: tyrosine-type recombinase/integrase [Candidatus Limiplasma sp.]|nr:tyrosine-type recombinase/integrase [Candidatus Limiplasma sp.]